MSVERTLSIIKPDAVSQNVIGKIYTCFESAGLKVAGSKMMHLTKEQASQFYAEHDGRPFFEDLVTFMSGSPVMVQVLEGEGAIAKNREIMGPTNPDDAAPGTIRAQFATATNRNAVHGSDSAISAAREIAFFFSDSEVFSL